jgi:hypothetical protein
MMDEETPNWNQLPNSQAGQTSRKRSWPFLGLDEEVNHQTFMPEAPTQELNNIELQEEGLLTVPVVDCLLGSVSTGEILCYPIAHTSTRSCMSTRSWSGMTPTPYHHILQASSSQMVGLLCLWELHVQVTISSCCMMATSLLGSIRYPVKTSARSWTSTWNCEPSLIRMTGARCTEHIVLDNGKAAWGCSKWNLMFTALRTMLTGLENCYRMPVYSCSLRSFFSQISCSIIRSFLKCLVFPRVSKYLKGLMIEVEKTRAHLRRPRDQPRGLVGAKKMR